MPRTSNCSPDSLAVGGSSYPLIQASVETHYELGLTIGRAACPRIRSWLKAYTALQAVLPGTLHVTDSEHMFRNLRRHPPAGRPPPWCCAGTRAGWRARPAM